MDKPLTKEAAPFATWQQIRDDAARRELTHVRLAVHGRNAGERVVSFAFVCAQAAMEAPSATRTFDVQILNTPAGWLGIPHLKPRTA